MSSERDQQDRIDAALRRALESGAFDHLKPRDPSRIPTLLASLTTAWSTAPDLRLGQLLTILAGPDDLFVLEDDELARRIALHLTEKR